MIRTSFIVILVAALAITGCARLPPRDAICGVDRSSLRVTQPNTDPRSDPTQSTIAQGISGNSMADALPETMVDKPQFEQQGPLTVEVLALSAGGQFGAFGAGFLRGWAENTVTPRPRFQLVTGVSAGAMIAPIVFAGTEFDEQLDAYRGIGVDEIFKRRSLLALLTAPSFGDVTPLREFLDASLTDELIKAIGENHDDGRRLLALATDLNETKAAIFDLGGIAASKRSLTQKRLCMREVMQASAAIPGLFPPRSIDGTLLADGGLRDQIFLRSIEDARQQFIRETGRDVRVSATIVVNGSLRPPKSPVRYGLLPYAKRSATILSDEVLRDSISDVVRFAQSQPNWSVRGVFADTDLSQCSPQAIDGTFDPCVTRMIFDDGRQKAQMARIPWLGPEELLELASEF